MAFKIGAKIALDGEKEYRQAVADMNSNLKVLQSEMKALTSGFDSNKKSMADAQAQQKNLTQQYQQQAEKVKQLEAALENAKKEFGEGSRQAQNWEIQLNNAKAAMNGTQKELNKTNKELKELKKQDSAIGKLKTAFNEVKEKVEETHKKTEKLREAMSKIASVSGTVLKAGMAGIAATAAGATALVKQVTEAYGELEQNLGGAESVFGEYADTVKKTSEDAYKALGATQSEYLATANKMGALFQGSGVEQARSAELTTQAMQRAADMASVMGIETSAALEAVTGAAKGNYSMMDNLGVKMDNTTLAAYAAAKGYETLWKDMGNAEKAEVAMAYFFEQTSQYAGNFEREATETISGSLGLLSAAWGTFVAGLGNSEADIENLTRNVFDALEAVIDNIAPLIDNMITVLPKAIQQALDTIMKSGILQKVLNLAVDLIQTLIRGFEENHEEVIAAALEIIAVLTTSLLDMLPDILEVGIELIIGLVEGLSDPAMLGQIIEAGITCAGELIKGLIRCVPDLMDAGWNLIKGLWSGISDAAGWLWEQIKGIGSTLVNTIKGIFGIKSPSTVMRDQIGKNLMLGMADGIREYAGAAKNAMREATASMTGSAEMTYRISTISDQIYAAQQFRAAATYQAPARRNANGVSLDEVVALLKQIATNNDSTAVLTPDGQFAGWIDRQLGARAELAGRYI